MGDVRYRTSEEITTELRALRASHEAIRAEIPQLEDLAGEPAYGLPLASSAARRVVAAWRAAEPK